MIVDSSAVAAIFFRRPGHERLIDALAGAEGCAIGAPTLAEAVLEIGATAGRDAHGLVARFTQEFRLTVIPFGDAHSRAAADAHRRFGSGRGALELGECLAYATARLAGQPLLADDPRFAATDLELA